MRRLVPFCSILLFAFPLVAQAPPRWKLVEEWRVGGEADGPHSFDAVAGLAVLPGGAIVHLDGGARRLHFLDAKGKPLRSVGRRGGGPGEFQQPVGLAVAADGRIVVNDLANGFVLFDPQGKHLRTTQPGKRLWGAGGTWPIGMLPDGGVIESVKLLGRQGAGRPPVRVRWSPGLQQWDSSATPDCGAKGGASSDLVLRKADGSPATTMALPYLAPTRPVEFAADGTVWEAMPAGTRTLVRHRPGDCTPLATVTLPDTRAPLTSSLAGRVRRMVAAEAKRWGVAAPPLTDLPATMAWFQWLRTDTQGNLLVSRASGPWGVFEVEVYSPSGAALGVFPYDGGAPVAATADRLHVVSRDADGIAWLTAYRIAK